MGTSGWSYDDWKGPFYPETLPKRGFLEFYARHFDTVEVNSTYYAPPTRKLVEGLVRRTGGEMTFCVKAGRRMTHERDAGDGEWQAFRDALEPLVEAGTLGAVLAQFPQSLRPDREGRRALERLRGGFEGWPLAVEFRHRDWDDDRVYEWMSRNDVALCCVDVPDIASLFPPVARVTNPSLGYMRCHGRRADTWYEHEEAWQRYDYAYADREIAEHAARVEQIAGETRDQFVFYNNHYRARAVDGARRLRRAMGGEVTS